MKAVEYAMVLFQMARQFIRNYLGVRGVNNSDQQAATLLSCVAHNVVEICIIEQASSHLGAFKTSSYGRASKSLSYFP